MTDYKDEFVGIFTGTCVLFSVHAVVYAILSDISLAISLAGVVVVFWAAFFCLGHAVDRGWLR